MGDKEDNTYDIPIPLQYIGCQDLLGEEGCSHSGWLRKKRTVSIFTWPQAYVVLHEGCLYYFKNERERKPAGKFSLYGYNSVFRAGEIPPKEAPWVFKIVHSHSEFRTYFFSASSENEMKTWMVKIKQEMLKANGKVLLYGKKMTKEHKPEDEHSFYQAIETSIYDDAAKFQVTKEYSKQYSIKRENEDSDDEEPKQTTHVDIDHRPPLPLPGQSTDSTDGDERAPLPPPRPVDGPAALPPKPPFKPPRIPDTEQPPTSSRHTELKAQESRSRSPSPSMRHVSEQRLIEDLHSKLKIKREDKKNTAHKRSDANLVRGSYEKTDGPGNTGNKLPANQPKTHTAKFQIGTPRTSGGGSTGEDDFDTDVDTDDYWEAIHFRDGSKQQANDIIQAIGEEGVYLVRPGEDGLNQVLVVFAQDTIKKYRIQKSEDGQYFLAKEGFRNNQLEELLRFYYEEDLPTVQVKLTGPYRLHAKFKKLNL